MGLEPEVLLLGSSAHHEALLLWIVLFPSPLGTGRKLGSGRVPSNDPTTGPQDQQPYCTVCVHFPNLLPHGTPPLLFSF